MAHIHTDPGQHDATASAYIVRLDGTEPAIILHKHRLLNKWLQFGGHVELDENPWSAITHEIAEESGYSMQQLKILQPSIRLAKVTGANLHPYPVAILTHQFGDTDHYHTDTGYAFVTRELPSGVIEEDESTTFKTFSATELAAIPIGEIPENVRETGLFVLEKCLSDWVTTDTTDF